MISTYAFNTYMKKRILLINRMSFLFVCLFVCLLMTSAIPDPPGPTDNNDILVTKGHVKVLRAGKVFMHFLYSVGGEV